MIQNQDEPSFPARLETRHFLLLAEADGPASRVLTAVGTRLEAAYSATVEILDLHIVPEGPIRVILHDARTAELRAIGEPDPGPREWSGPPWQLSLIYLSDHPAPDLEESVVSLLLACSAGAFTQRTPMLVHGLLRHAAEARTGSGVIASERLAELRRKGIHVGVESAIFGPGSMETAHYYDCAAAFVSFLLKRYGPDNFRRFAARFDPRDPNTASDEVYRKPLAILESEWLDSLREFRPPPPTVLDFFRLAAGYLRRNWMLVTALLLAVVGGLADPILRPILLRSVLDEVVGGRDSARLVQLVSALVGVLLFQSVATLLREYLGGRLSAAIATDLPGRIFDHLQKLSLQYFNQQRVSELAARIIDEVDSIQAGIGTTMVQAISAALTLTASSLLLLWVDWRLALVSLLAMTILVVVPYLVSPRVQATMRGRRMAMVGARRTMSETLGALHLVRLFGLEARATERFREQMGALARNTALRGLWQGVELTSVNSGAAIAQVAVFMVGAFMVLDDSLSVGSLYLFSSVMRMGIVASFTELTKLPRPIRGAAGSMRFVEELLAEPAEAADSEEAVKLGTPAREIRLHEVTFSYSGDQISLRDVNLRLPIGKRIALVGSSGSGKTSVIALLARLYEANIGKVTIDGLDITRVTRASLRRQIAVVPQDGLMLNGTIAENIRMGLDATEAEVERAARTAQIHDFIVSLPAGYETEVGSDGARLSGGQRQRITLARALLRRPSVLVLDEATSALDPETEAAVYAALWEESAGRTLIFATHRLETVVDCDLIVLFEKGQVAEEGRHGELMALEGLYAQMWRRQHMIAAGEAVASPHVDLLRAIPFFSQVEPRTLARVANHFVEESFQGGEPVFRQGDPGDKFYVVVQGTLDVELSLPTGQRRRLATLHDGDCFGEMALLFDAPRSATISARSPARLLALDQASFNNLMHMEPGLRPAIESMMTERRRQNAAAARHTPS